MSDDFFDHPDLRDPEWGAKLKRETRRSFWRRNRLRFGVVLAVLAVVAGVVVYNTSREEPPVAAMSPAVSPQSSATTPTAAPVATSTSVQTDVRTGGKVDLRQPFAGTPAAGWRDGDAGLVMPEVKSVNGFSTADVTEAVTEARAAFIAARLDRRVIQDGNVDVLAELFAPDAQKTARDETGFRQRIKPGFRLLDVAPKVNGQLTVEPGKKGELSIRANYVVVYAFDTDNPGDLVDEMDILAVVRTDQRYVFRKDLSFARSSWGLWLDRTEGYSYSIACSAAKEGLLAPAYSERRLGGGNGSADRAKVFDPNAPMMAADTC
jgi:hypothetical protein